ncbi:MAG: NAD(P)-binding protein, partial [Mycobacteriales bacterium]
MQSSGAARPQQPSFVICGSGSLALRLVKDLMRLDEPITVIVGNPENPFAQRIARTGARVLYGSKRDAEVLQDAGIAHARSLALADSDDVGNVHAALAAQELNPRLRLVMRMYRRQLARRIESLFDECTLLSPADIAAPSFADAALGDGSHLVRVAGRVLQ